jgi:iron complex outermembrane receptor protein
MKYRLLACAFVAGAIPAVLMPEASAQGAPGVDTIALDPVEVTARRREEQAQDAPVAVTVVPSEDIGRGKVDTLEDAAFRSLNTIFNAQGGPLAMRGVGSLGISAGVDRQPGVGLFLDDVFVARPFGYPTYLDDTERVELVRGSQSTLYGKNTIGGAVNLVQRNPGQRLGAMVEGSLGTGPGGRLRASFDAPIAGSELGVRGFASWTGQRGYITNENGGPKGGDADSFATRFVALGLAGTATTLKLSVDYQRNRDDGGLWYAPLSQAYNYRADHDFKPTSKLDIGGVTARVDHDFANVRLTSISALRGHEMTSFLDGDFTAMPMIGQGQTESQRQFSEDLRLSGTIGQRLRWTGGLFYMYERFDATQYFDLVSVPQDLWSRDAFNQTANTYSAFGELGYNLTEALELVGGLRYTYETKSTTSEISSPSGTFMFGMPGRASGRMSFNNWSPEIAANYRFAPGKLAFAKVSRGFKSGGISPYIEANNQPNKYEPELTTSYELGVKTAWLGDRLNLNGSLFYIDWKDQQAVIYTSPFTRVIRNAAAATSKGLELEAAMRVTEALTLTAGYGWLDAKYDDFVDTVMNQNYSGKQLPYAPRTSLSAGMRWRSKLTEGWHLVAGADYAYRSQYGFTPDNNYRQPQTNIVDARIGVEGDHWSASLWTKNLLDEKYLKQYFNYAGTDMGVLAQGRTVGVTVSARW